MKKRTLALVMVVGMGSLLMSLARANVDQDLQQGKVEAAYEDTLAQYKLEMRRNIQQMELLQEDVGMDGEIVEGKLSAMGQLIMISDQIEKEALKDGSFKAIKKAHLEILENKKEAMRIFRLK